MKDLQRLEPTLIQNVRVVGAVSHNPQCVEITHVGGGRAKKLAGYDSYSIHSVLFMIQNHSLKLGDVSWPK